MIFVITGNIRSGKSTMLRGVLEILKREDIPFRGYRSEAVLEHGRPMGYDLVNVHSGARKPLINSKVTGAGRAGRYGFVKGIKPYVANMMKNLPPKCITVMDELGPAEIKDKKGLWPSAKKVLLKKDGMVLAVVRLSLKDSFLKVIEGCSHRTYIAGRNSSYETAMDMIDYYNDPE